MKILLSVIFFHIVSSSTYGQMSETQCQYYVDDNVRLAKAQIELPVNCSSFTNGQDFSNLNHAFCESGAKTVPLGQLLRAHDELNAKLFLLQDKSIPAKYLEEIAILGARSPEKSSDGSLLDKIRKECDTGKSSYQICKINYLSDSNMVSILNSDQMLNLPNVSLLDYGRHTSSKTQNFYQTLLANRANRIVISEMQYLKNDIKKLIDQAVGGYEKLHKIQKAKLHIAQIVSKNCINSEAIAEEKITCDDFAKAKKIENPNIKINLAIVGSIAGGQQIQSFCRELDPELMANLYTCRSTLGGEDQLPDYDKGYADKDKKEEENGPNTLDILGKKKREQEEKIKRAEYYNDILEHPEKISYVANWKKFSGWRPPAGEEHLYMKKIVGYTPSGLAINEYRKRTPWKYVVGQAALGFARWAPGLWQMYSTQDQFKAQVAQQVEIGKIQKKAWACYNPSKFYNSDGSFNAELFEANCLNGRSAFYPNFSAPPFAGTSSTLTSPYGLGITPGLGTSTGLGGFSFASPSALGGAGGLSGISGL